MSDENQIPVVIRASKIWYAALASRGRTRLGRKHVILAPVNAALEDHKTQRVADGAQPTFPAHLGMLA